MGALDRLSAAMNRLAMAFQVALLFGFVAAAGNRAEQGRLLPAFESLVDDEAAFLFVGAVAPVAHETATATAVGSRPRSCR